MWRVKQKVARTAVHEMVEYPSPGMRLSVFSSIPSTPSIFVEYDPVASLHEMAGCGRVYFLRFDLHPGLPSRCREPAWGTTMADERGLSRSLVRDSILSVWYEPLGMASHVTACRGLTRVEGVEDVEGPTTNAALSPRTRRTTWSSLLSEISFSQAPSIPSTPSILTISWRPCTFPPDRTEGDGGCGGYGGW